MKRLLWAAVALPLAQNATADVVFVPMPIDEMIAFLKEETFTCETGLAVRGKPDKADPEGRDAACWHVEEYTTQLIDRGYCQISATDWEKCK